MSWTTVLGCDDARMLTIACALVCCAGNRLCIVTSQFHMPRARAIFEWIMGLPINEDTPPPEYDLTFVSSKNVGMDPDTLRERMEKEEKSRQSVMDMQSKYLHLDTLHQWLFNFHSAYSVGRLNQEPTKLRGAVLKSY